MRVLIALAFAGSLTAVTATGASGESVGICGCCDEPPAAACRPVCQQAQAEAGFCRPAIMFGEEVELEPGANPLAAPSLKYLSLAGGDAADLEATRRFLERWRRIAEARFGQARLDYLAGRIRKDALDASLAVRNAVLVNYQHGMRAYRAALGRQATAQ